MMNKIKNMMAIFLLVCSSSSYAAFGETCTTPGQNALPTNVVNSLSYMMYAYVLSQIDLTTPLSYNGGPARGCYDNNPNALYFSFSKNGPNPRVDANASNSVPVVLNINTGITLNQIVNNFDPTIGSIQLIAYNFNGQFCLVMKTIYGPIPLTCRSANNLPPSPVAVADDQCSNVSSGCNLYSQNNPSMSPNNFFGSAVQCVYESLNTIFFNPVNCPQVVDKQNQVRPFSDFFTSLSFAVALTIVIYITFYGTNMALNPTEVTVGDVFMFFLKGIAVTYFAIGYNTFDFVSGATTNQNGVTEIILPFMLNFATSMSSYFFNNAESSGLCYFNMADYPTQYGYYSLWDSLDCRMNVYLGHSHVFWNDVSGFNLVSQPANATFPNSMDTSHLPAGLQAIAGDPIASTVATPFLAVLSGLIFGGEIFPFAVLVFVMMIVIGLMFSVFMSYVASILLMYILAYISPIFVPMALFERTKSYFEAWKDLCMGTALQPVIVLSFSAFIFMMIDSFMFNQCVFAKYSYMDNVTGNLKYIFRLMIANGDGGACVASMGYKLFQYFQSSTGWHGANFVLFELNVISDVLDLEKSAWSGAIVCFFMRYLLDQIYNISDDLSGGINLKNVTIKATAVINAAVTAGKAVTKGPDKAAKEEQAKEDKEKSEGKDEQAPGAEDSKGAGGGGAGGAGGGGGGPSIPKGGK